MMSEMRRLAGILFVAFLFHLHAEDARLIRLRSLLVPMRANQMEQLEARGATPELTNVKHVLREWIESRISAFHWSEWLERYWDEAPGALARQLNEDLRKADLFCGSEPHDNPCPDSSELGFIGEIKLDIQHGSILVLRTAVGIQQCGFDQSAYAYRWTEDHWQRFWQSEQNDYTEKKYFPQLLDGVLVSPENYVRGDDRSEHLVLTLGTNPWCTSSWQPVYYRVWQTKDSYPEPKLLLDEREISFLGSDSPIQGSVRENQVLIEYDISGIDVGVPRREVRRYVVNQGKIERVDPIALSPRDFADNWVRHPWTESSHWTEQSVRAALEKWHQKRYAALVFGDFIDPTFHCEQKPDLWQVGINFGEPGKAHDSEYFLIRWRPPYHFTMVGVSGRPWPDCTQPDPEADESRSLFPSQD